jgi:hypothetical protein
MRRTGRIFGIAGLAGLLALALPSLLWAQEQETRARAAAGAGGSPAEQDNQLLISHAIGTAINGSNLQLAAQQAAAQGRRQEGQDQGTAQQRQQQQEQQQQQQAQQQRRQQVVQLIQQQARQQFESSDRLLRTAKDNLGPEDRDNWSRRLYTVADQYTNTLRALAGVDSARAGRSDIQGGQGARERARGEQGEGPSSAREEISGGGLGRLEVASVALINNAVHDALEAFELRRATQEARGARSQSAQVQQLREHARQMPSNSKEVLQRFLTTYQGADDAAAEQQREARGGQRGEQRQGRASVRELAQQAQQVVETFERISASAPGDTSGAGGRQEDRPR